jgi:ATP/maltotriose-dependent transcriptional regulator MalT
MRTDEVLDLAVQMERDLVAVAPAVALPLHAAVRLLRAAGLALQGDSLAALAIAMPQTRRNTDGHSHQVALTLCRLSFWQLGELDSLQTLPRPRPGPSWRWSRAVPAVANLAIEAAVALDRLHISAAKRLAADALVIAESAKVGEGMAALPACIQAQALYEEGYPDEAEAIVKERLQAVKAEGSIDCVARAYLLLARIARLRMNYDLAAILLREAEAVGERRRWPRLVAACSAARIGLLLEAGRTREARLGVDYLERYTETHCADSGRSHPEIQRHRQLARWRVEWSEASSPEAVTAIRQIYRRAIERRELHAGCGLAIELANMLLSVGELKEADALFRHVVGLAMASGLYQVFLEGRMRSAELLARAYDRADQAGSPERDVLPFIGSLLARQDAAQTQRAPVSSAKGISNALTIREHDILVKISEGLPNKRIARTLDISPETVKSHLKRIFSKLAVSTRAEAVSRASSLGLL